MSEGFKGIGQEFSLYTVSCRDLDEKMETTVVSAQ